MSPSALRDLAILIANDLFVNGMGERARRLVLTVDGPPRRDLGGWSEAAMIDRIEVLLKREYAQKAQKVDAGSLAPKGVRDVPARR